MNARWTQEMDYREYPMLQDALMTPQFFVKETLSVVE
jgi:hypothetical protein